MEGLEELDVIGLHFESEKAYLCEVTTHTVRGIDLNSVKRLVKKRVVQIKYAKKYLKNFKPVFEFWAPRVFTKGQVITQLEEMKKEGEGLELIINGVYKKRVEELRKRADAEKNLTENPFFRMLKIMESMNDR